MTTEATKEPTNADRANRAREALRKYIGTDYGLKETDDLSSVHSEDLAGSFQDLFSDLRHLADAAGISQEQLDELQSAGAFHYRAEREEEEESAGTVKISISDMQICLPLLRKQRNALLVELGPRRKEFIEGEILEGVINVIDILIDQVLEQHPHLAPPPEGDA